MSEFMWRHLEGEIILWTVRWYYRYGISYRDLEQMMRYARAERRSSTSLRTSAVRLASLNALSESGPARSRKPLQSSGNVSNYNLPDARMEPHPRTPLGRAYFLQQSPFSVVLSSS